MADFSIKQNDTLPALNVQLLGVDSSIFGIPEDASIRFVMRRQNNKQIVINTTNVQVIDAANGVVSYRWLPTDTANEGLFDMEFELTVGGQRITFPNSTYRVCEIVADLLTQ